MSPNPVQCIFFGSLIGLHLRSSQNAIAASRLRVIQGAVCTLKHIVHGVIATAIACDSKTHRYLKSFILTANPQLLLLDEPAGGLNHEEVAELGTLIRSIRDQLGITVLLVEHHMGLVMGLSDQVVVLNFGGVIADGTPDEVRGNPAVTEAYLGTRH